MADEEHVALLKQRVEIWNKWRKANPEITPNLARTDLAGVKLSRWDLNMVDPTRAVLLRLLLTKDRLTMMDVGREDRDRMNLTRVNLTGAHLPGANLIGADLIKANLTGAHLGEAVLGDTVFGNTNLFDVKELDRCRHSGPSIIDHQTLQRSGPLPLAFLRGVGLPNNLIDYLPSLLNQPIQFFSCFISYSSKDQDFAERLHADLQNKGVRCWFAPHNMDIGDEIRIRIDEEISRLQERCARPGATVRPAEPQAPSPCPLSGMPDVRPRPMLSCPRRRSARAEAWPDGPGHR
jgi:hypothetical protein